MIVDDEAVIADTLAIILAAHGYPCATAYDGDEAIEKARWLKPKFILLGVVMPRMNGIEAARRIRDEQPECDIRLFSGQAATADLLNEARSDGYEFRVSAKPLPPTDLIEMVKSTGITPEPGFARFRVQHECWPLFGLLTTPIMPGAHNAEVGATPIRQEQEPVQEQATSAAKPAIAAVRRPGWRNRILHRIRYRAVPVTLDLEPPVSPVRPKAGLEHCEAKPLGYELRFCNEGPAAALCLDYQRNWRKNAQSTEFLTTSATIRQFPKVNPKRIFLAPWFFSGEIEAAREREICLIRHNDLFEAAYAIRGEHNSAALRQAIVESLLLTSGEWSFSNIAVRFAN